MLHMTCPHCGVNLEVADEYAGQAGRCKHCKGPIVAPLRPSTAFEAPKMSRLQLDPDRPRQAPQQQQASTGSITVVGWVLFVATLLTCGLFAFITIPVTAFLVGVDANRRGLGGAQIAIWIIGVIFLWPFVFPAYLIVQDNLKPRAISVGTPILLGIAFFLAYVLLLANYETDTQTTRAASPSHRPALERNTTPPRVLPTSPTPVVTLAEFNQLQNGMSYQQAVSIIGTEGTVMSESNFAGYNTVMYTWQNPGFFEGNMNAMFQNNALISKAQLGLK